MRQSLVHWVGTSQLLITSWEDNVLISEYPLAGMVTSMMGTGWPGRGMDMACYGAPMEPSMMYVGPHQLKQVSPQASSKKD